ncbi:hypothetical protein COE80_07420 [Bacillus pseudomycoides]|nr:hypothetical protein COM62_03125 [Bacillus pseudomycoides]PHB30455.1 hypothetical protein COE80_07420 [Bacillus pseudomycoides]PHE39386.1 hypothetical protein COF51_06775 [Bacillus pseudomycoides]
MGVLLPVKARLVRANNQCGGRKPPLIKVSLYVFAFHVTNPFMCHGNDYIIPVEKYRRIERQDYLFVISVMA